MVDIRIRFFIAGLSKWRADAVTSIPCYGRVSFALALHFDPANLAENCVAEHVSITRGRCVQQRLFVIVNLGAAEGAGK